MVTARAAVAHAAWQGRPVVTEEDIRAAARLALPHRRRRQPFDAPGLDERQLDEALAAGADEDQDPDPTRTRIRTPAARPGRTRGRTRLTGRPGRHPGADAAPDGGSPAEPPGGPPPAADDRSGEPGQPAGDGDGDQGATGRAAPAQPPAAPGPVFRVRHLEVPGIGDRRGRAALPRPGPAGAVTGAQRPHGPARRLHLAGDAGRGRAAPACAGAAPARAGCGCAGRTCARRAARAGRATWCCSWWTPAARWRPGSRMGAVKGAVLSLLLDAYQRRDKVGLITLPRLGRRAAAAADLVGGGGGGPAGRAAHRRAHPARGRAAARARGAAHRAAPRPGAPAAARRGDRRPGHGRPGRRSPGPAGRHGCWPPTAAPPPWWWTARRARSGWAWRASWPGRCAGAVLQLDELAAGPLAASVRAISGNPLPARTLAGEEVA